MNKIQEKSREACFCADVHIKNVQSAVRSTTLGLALLRIIASLVLIGQTISQAVVEKLFRHLKGNYSLPIIMQNGCLIIITDHCYVYYQLIHSASHLLLM